MCVERISAGRSGQTAVKDEKTHSWAHSDQERFVNKSLLPCACGVLVFLGSHVHNLLPEEMDNRSTTLQQ